MFINREIDRNMFIEIDLNVKKVCKKVVNDNEVVKKDNVKKDDNNIFGEKICFYPPCLNRVSGNNYCHLIDNMRFRCQIINHISFVIKI